MMKEPRTVTRVQALWWGFGIGLIMGIGIGVLLGTHEVFAASSQCQVHDNVCIGTDGSTTYLYGRQPDGTFAFGADQSGQPHSQWGAGDYQRRSDQPAGQQQWGTRQQAERWKDPDPARRGWAESLEPWRRP